MVGNHAEECDSYVQLMAMNIGRVKKRVKAYVRLSPDFVPSEGSLDLDTGMV